MNSQQRMELAALCRRVRWDANMASYSTFRAGGTVEAFVEVADAPALARLIRWLAAEDLPWRVIGGGSNILVASRYHPGVFIRLDQGLSIPSPALSGEADDDPCPVTVGAGCHLATLVHWCARNGLAGLEFMAGIPGSVGGAVRMNAGAFGHTIGEVLTFIECVSENGDICQIGRESIGFSYRSTSLPGEPEARLIITRATFLFRQEDSSLVEARCREIVAQRRDKQPAGVGSAGSFFKNPQGDFAGRLIEQAGLKGLMRGRAMVSPKHANFIVNTGGAAPEDIIGLMQEVRARVLQQTGVLLEPEVHIL